MTDERDWQPQCSLAARDGICRALFQQSAVGAALVDTKTGVFLRVNQKCAEIAGYSVSEMEHLAVQQITHPDDLPDVRQSMQRLLAGEIREFTAETRHHRKDGSILWAKATLMPLWAPGEEPTVHLVLVDDITQFRLAERHYQSLFREMLNGFALHEVICNEQGHPVDFCYLAVNPAFERITGLAAADVVGKTILELAPETGPEFIERFGRVALNGEPVILENYFPQLDTHYVVSAFQTAPNQFASIFEDITDRKRSESALRASEERCRLAQRLSGVGTWEWNARTNEVFWSDEVFTMWGFGHDAFRGSFDEVAERIHPDDLPLWQENVRACVEDGKEHNIEYRVVWPDGTVRWVAAYGNAERDEGSKAIRMFGVVMDITERKRVQQEREELIATLEAQNAELERFTYTVSHDLKSPLITIKGYIGLLAQNLHELSHDSIKSDLARISGAADRMTALMANLLELSRIGRLVNPPECIPLGELVNDALGIVAGRPEARQVEFDVTPDLPVIFGDRIRLLEVVQNLIENAVKYMGDQAFPRIEIGARCADGETVLHVRDNGIGIEPRFHEKVFSLFDQLDPTADGTGIGLALVKRIVEVHGGRIWVESEGKAGGSTFFVALPNASPPESKSSNSATQDHAACYSDSTSR